MRRRFRSCAFLRVHTCNAQKGALNAASHSVSELILCVWVCVQSLAHNQWPPACVVLTPTPLVFLLHHTRIVRLSFPFSFQLALNFVVWKLGTSVKMTSAGAGKGPRALWTPLFLKITRNCHHSEATFQPRPFRLSAHTGNNGQRVRPAPAARSLSGLAALWPGFLLGFQQHDALF